MRSFRTHVLAVLIDQTAHRYRRALDIDPSDIVSRYRLARMLGMRAEYGAALDLLQDIDPRAVEGVEEGVASEALMKLDGHLRDRQQDPFSFIADVQQAALAQVGQSIAVE
jgi:hypothetical protein